MDEIAFDYNDCHDHEYWISKGNISSMKNLLWQEAVKLLLGSGNCDSKVVEK